MPTLQYKYYSHEVRTAYNMIFNCEEKGLNIWDGGDVGL
jgi:hypothetical protein